MKPCNVDADGPFTFIFRYFFCDAVVTMLLFSCIFSAKEETLAILEKHSLVEEAPAI
jgi:hypothetical protein